VQAEYPKGTSARFGVKKGIDIPDGWLENEMAAFVEKSFIPI
jgi:hypothetical protein